MVFFMNLLPLESDYAWVENESEVQMLESLLKSAYRRTGYDLVEVPAMSIDERVEFEISHLPKSF